VESKNVENTRKHEIDFADVPTMFDGEMLIELDDRLEMALKAKICKPRQTGESHDKFRIFNQ
jgi:uncharacterized DUF497 family protein